MSCRKISKCLIFPFCLMLMTPHPLSGKGLCVSYQRKIDLDYRRQTNAVSVPVDNPSVCALECAKKVTCVSFFFNILESLCQTEGTIYLSFDGSDAGPWQYYEMKAVNAAFNKTATMSSIFHPSKPYYVVDGRVVLNGHAGQCSHTQDETNPWITVDLGTIYVVQYVTLFNRIDAHGHRLHNVFVTLGDTDTEFPVSCGQFKGPGVNAEVVHIICPNNARGRFVKTEIKGQTPSEVVVLCEIRVLISL